MTSLLKLCFKRNMHSSENPEGNPEGEKSPRSINESSFVSFPPRFDDVGERTLTCPTCGGSGKLTQEHENDLVALIPVSDKRLKPRKRVYIIIALLLLVLVAGILTAVFIFPRDVTLKLTNSTLFDITLAPVNGTKAVMFLNVTLQIENKNYFAVTVNKINQQVTWGGSYVVADTTFTKQLAVQAKSTTTHKVTVKLVYDGESLCKKMKRACCWFKLLFIIVTQSHADGLTASQDISNKVYRYVDCLADSHQWGDKCGQI